MAHILGLKEVSALFAKNLKEEEAAVTKIPCRTAYYKKTFFAERAAEFSSYPDCTEGV